ncbi:hypothetical protein F5884DRAFT_503167 [Xylogone sp. PMI_703]|nr:hypothetical protein F5884DRAFT_503167 [Xylogone sp. PMI_703]
MAAVGSQTATSTLGAGGPMDQSHPPHMSSSEQAPHVNRASSTRIQVLDDNQKLSAAGAAASLKFASPRDLPSYPSAGLKADDSAAGRAATLGWTNQKSIEPWKPNPSASASAAAVLAKDYKMAPGWKPEQSSHGARAALLAHRDNTKVEAWKPEANNWGNSAANQAFKRSREGARTPQPESDKTALDRRGSLLAATGAMSNSRKRAISTPVPMIKVESYPDESNAAANALRAATSATKSSPRSSSLLPEGGSVPFTAMSREMYTSHPPVAPEVEDQHHNDVLRASAVAMAKKMYTQQQKQLDTAKHGAATAAHRRQRSMSSIEEIPAMTLTNASLQEAAQKLAQERLAKVYAEHMQSGIYPARKPSKLTIRGRTRRRASSDSMIDDREQSDRIRAQMSIFSDNLSQVDAKKRQQEREALIAAAQRNVTNKLHSMDEQVFADTGKVAPSLLTDWEVKAHAAAQVNSATRMENYGKVDIGGGKFVDQSDVDAIAARNIQPVLDEINEKAEKEKARLAAIKLDEEEKQRKAESEKARNKEISDINKKLKQQEKDERRAKKNEEKAAKAEEKRLAKEKRKSKEPGTPLRSPVIGETENAAVAAETIEQPETPIQSPAQPQPEPQREESHLEEEGDHQVDESHETHEAPEIHETPEQDIRTSMEREAEQRMQQEADRANKDMSTPISPSSPGESKVKNWLNKFRARRLSRTKSSPNTTGDDKAFIGGAALTGGAASANNSTSSLEANPSSMREVALAGRNREEEHGEDQRIGMPSSRDDEVSSLSTEGPHEETGEENQESEEARDAFDQDLAPPPTFLTVKSSSPARDSRFREVID